ncbi:hypothetical protein JTB14_024009 [Gonioctena quinquepunctata]|nr:hypothetical protein JTB14_024009 [Gonioctena quinquepunctata]
MIKKHNSRVIQFDKETDGELDNTIKMNESHNRQKLPPLQNSCCNYKNTEAKLNSAIRKIEFLAQDVKFLLQIVQRNAFSEHVETPENLILPINQEGELKEFDRKLADEDFFRNAAASFLSIGGKDVGDATRRLITKIVSHELSIQYNWTGRGKKEFMSLKNVPKMILVCLRKNPLTRNATEAEVAGVVKIWLRTAPDRQGGRNKRRTKTAEEGGDGTPDL